MGEAFLIPGAAPVISCPLLVHNEYNVEVEGKIMARG